MDDVVLSCESKKDLSDDRMFCWSVQKKGLKVNADKIKVKELEGKVEKDRTVDGRWLEYISNLSTWAVLNELGTDGMECCMSV